MSEPADTKEFKKMELDLQERIELQKLHVEIWTKAIDVQMHFNEMSVKSRQLGLSLVVAALGLSVVLLTRPNDLMLTVSIYNVTASTHVSGLIVLLACIGV